MNVGFGKRLRELRKAAGFTLRGLAEKTSVDFTYLSKMETGKLPYTPASETIRTLADVLRANPLELLRLADKLPPELNQLSEVPAARRFMDRAQRVASPQDWEALLDVLERRHAERENDRKGGRS
jgi:transcriptional regulator with XRE-family HTH domain